MGLQKIVFNFLVKNTNGRLVTSSLLHTKPKMPINIKGLKYMAALGNDTVQISNSAKRWIGKAEQYIPDCSLPHCSVPRHHAIDGLNNDIRCVADLKKGFVDDCEMIGGYQAVRVDNEFARLTPLEKDCISYRGVQRGASEWRDEPYRIVSNAKVGDIIIPDQGCGYAAHKIDLAEGCVGKGGMLYTIRIPKGARVSRNMEHGGEILMPRGAEYRLISKQLRPDGKMDVTLEYILPKSVVPEDIPQIKKIAEQYVNSTNKLNNKYAKMILDEISKLEQLRT